MYQIIASGSAENHAAVKRAFANLVRELRKIDQAMEARYLSVDGHEPDHVVHPRSLLPKDHREYLVNEDGSEGHTGENPQLISGTESEVR